MTKKQPTTQATQKETKAANSELRAPQVRVLAALAKAKEPLSRSEIAKRATVDAAWLTEYVGSSDKKVRAKNDKKFKSLLTLGYVAAKEEEGAATTYTITAAGRKALK